MSKIHEALEKLEALGFPCVPCEPKSKACKVPGWQEKAFNPSDFAANCNIGVRLGADFVDVDLDCNEAVKLAPSLLPPTACQWGRASRPRSHWIYRPKAAMKFQQFKDGTGRVLLELRTGAHQTLAPGSIHPSDEPIEFSTHGPPDQVDSWDLLQTASIIATCSLVMREAWGAGNHHQPAMGLAGVLVKAGVGEKLTLRAVKAMASVSTGVELDDVVAAVISTYKRHKEGSSVAGLKALREAGVSEASLTALAAWLPVSGGDSGAAMAPMGLGVPDWKNRLTPMTEFKKILVPGRKPLLGDWLKTGDSAILFGRSGHGKTLAALSIANAVSTGGSFGEFQAPSPQKVAYIDGELPTNDLQELADKLGLHGDMLIAASEAFLDAGETPDIANEAQQHAIMDTLISHGVRLAIFDNLFSLSLVREFVSNDDPGVVSITKFMARLRAAGIAAIFVHHATKSGKGFAGASRLEVPLDLTIELARKDDLFCVQFLKHRGRRAPKAFALELIASDEALNFMPVGATSMLSALDWLPALLRAVEPGSAIRKLAEFLKWPKSTVSDRLHQLAALGLVVKAKGGYRRTEAGEMKLTSLLSAADAADCL